MVSVADSGGGLSHSDSFNKSSNFLRPQYLQKVSQIKYVVENIVQNRLLSLRIVQRSNHRYPDHLISSKEGKDGDTSKETSAIPFASSDAGLHDDSQVLEFGESE